jgi:hypothetical protein
MSLRETLLKMEEGGKPSKQEIDTQLKEWREVAIPGLYQNIKDMLSDLIADGLISVSPPRIERRTEELTGPYDIEVMDLAMRGRTITVNPVGLFTAGAIGRVELFARGRLDRRYLLLRLKDNSSGKDRWVIFLEKDGPSFPLTNLPELSRENLEDVIEKLLLP